MKKFIIKNLKHVMFALSIIITILLGALIGIILVYQKGFPQIENLEDIKPKIMTVIHDDKSIPIREFAIEKRSIVRRQDIPEILVKAIIASEDNQFYTHWGINFKGTFRAIMGIMTGRNMGGGSSITQQLALNLFLTRQRTWRRKFQEMLMAIQIEKKYSKDQILTFYCNKIYLGGSVYGVEAGSRYYFGKSTKDITLAEAALIPTIMPSPNGKYNVFKKPKNCLIKRNYVLLRMLELGFIDKKQYKEAIQVPLPVKPHELEDEALGDYFVEDVRKQIEAKYGDNRLYTGGLKVYTTLNTEMQSWAEEALRQGLRDLDKRRGWRSKISNLFITNSETPASEINLEQEILPSWKQAKMEPSQIVEGIVLDVDNEYALVRFGDYRGRIAADDAKWTRKKLTQILKRGDVILIKILEMPTITMTPPNPTKPTPPTMCKLGLEQEPEVQGAILAVENSTGEIKAMVGGYSFDKSKWNNATQALRQTGSTFKPIIYTAAIENGYSPADIIVDEPVTFDNDWVLDPYSPQNHTGDFVGPLTLRRGLQQSRNVISAKIVETVTPPKIVQYAKNFGITADLKPYMSIALGAFEVTLKEMVAVYTVFPNLGTRVTPYMIKKVVDQNNHVLEEHYPDKKKVLEKETAFVMNYLLQGVVQMGTGSRARHLKAPIGGKTGTTDDFTDAWFIGFSPSITVGVWIGFDIKRKLGYEETGAKAASPVFVSFMENYLTKYPEPRYFPKPSGVMLIKIDRYTGKLYTPDCKYPFVEAFIKGSEPLEFCREEDHQYIHNYYGEESDDDSTPLAHPQESGDD